MKAGSFQRGLFIILLSLFLLPSGCSTTKNIYKNVYKKVTKFSPKKVVKKITFQDNAPDSLKKRVLLLPFMDRADLGKERVDSMTQTFMAHLNRNTRLILHEAKEPIPSNLQMRSPEFGVVIDPARARRAEEMGMNILLTVIINPFEFPSRTKGIWPLRYTKKQLEISMSVSALDITNGTLLLSQVESRKFDLLEDLMEWEEKSEKELRKNIDEKELAEAVAEILEDQAQAVAGALNQQPWSGRILSADREKVIISAGKDVGIETGNVFEVFDRGEPIRSASGRSYYLLGPKIGEVKTVQVMDSYASAVPLADTTLQAGYLVRIMRD